MRHIAYFGCLIVRVGWRTLIQTAVYTHHFRFLP